MKKNALTKLTVRRETLRALTNAELTRAGGGDNTDSGAAMCPGPAVSGAATCPVQAVIK